MTMQGRLLGRQAIGGWVKGLDSREPACSW